MGAWGEGPFDNDDAGDWAYELDGADAAGGLEILAAALDTGPEGAELDAGDGAVAVAAAAVVGWLHDPAAIPDSPYGEDAATWVRTTHPTVDPSLTAAALAALQRVRSEGSELAELWAEDDDGPWLRSLAEIEARLQPPA